MHQQVRAELLAMRDEDLRVRQELAEAGALGPGYNPRMEAVHRKNAARLRELVAEHGWPGRDIAGVDGAEAAWLILQHNIGEPEMQRTYLALLKAAVSCDQVPAWQTAYLVDRICVMEGRPQIYGTHFAYNDDGLMDLVECIDPDRLDERRASVGLQPVAESQREPAPPRISREQVERERRDMDHWARGAGWR
jgi:hypothetical protein